MSARTVALRVALPAGATEVLTAKVRVTIDGEPLELELVMPAGPVRLRDLMPLLHGLADLMAALGSERAEREGRSISCRKGCGACCRQPVPVTETEALRLAELVRSLPEPRQAEIRARFARAEAAVGAAGLLEPLRRPAELDRAELSAVGRAYFDLGVACPFLEQESCSIHPHRPIACREFLVTSPPSHCATPREQPVRGVRLPTHVFRAAQAMDSRSGSAGWTTLLLALEQVEQQAGAIEQPGLAWLREVFSEMGTIREHAPAVGMTARET